MKKIMFDDHFGLTKAVLDGRKTITRRIVHEMVGRVYEKEPDIVWDYKEECFLVFKDNDDVEPILLYPKYKIGEVVAVAQKYSQIFTEADLSKRKGGLGDMITGKAWDNKMFVQAAVMPHRIRITNIRVERLQDISNDDCLREGIYKQDPRPGVHALYAFETCTDQYGSTLAKRWYVSPREAFAALIDKVSGKGTWDSNPWVFVYEFELVK